MINLLNNLINNLGYLIFLAFIISNLSIFKNIIQKNEFQKFDLIILSITFAIFGIVGTYSGVDVNGAIANTRIIGIMAGGIFCGPFVGIVSGLIAGIHRLTYDIGGITSIPCALTTIIAGCFSGFIYKRCLKYEKWFYGLIGGIIIEIIEIFLILLLSKPYSKALHIVENIYLPMIFINALGTCLLILLIQRIFNEKENSISCTTKTLASGLSHLISTQLEISKLGKLKDLATKSEIKALQSQINPHFLFNSLNTIVSFMRFNPTDARELIINLSNYLRYNIDEIQTFVDISKELEHVKAYVEIEKARFGHKLNINYDIDKSVHIKIPSLIIQPLVENSIKHGILNGKGFGTVNIKVKKYNLDEVKVTIEDDGIGIPQNVIDIIYLGTIEKNKIGISNVNNRLKYIYGTGLIIERLHTGTRISFVLNKTKNFNFDII
ncbi:sensor histidine kinase [Clostridium gasigenes]|uniref:sensor histidine kinase n=1 Tax=Clostridium gasigenes TaxID=94869 RepID=UPI001C0D7046|nr:LytS/YhcK type 5TM receptor domain-containing protein [Clostridium gasigenes]MBU3105367.1 histidine kinase [Clostridium gasigenes]